MTLKRRSFLGLLGMTPLAAKMQLDQSIGTQAGIGQAPITPNLTPATMWQEAQPSDNYLASFGIPEFELENLKRKSKHVTALDPDIAAKKSWSMSVKILTQQQRNYEQLKSNTIEAAKWTIKRDAFIKTFGFWFKSYFY